MINDKASRNEITLEEITQALLDGYEDGIIWDYNNDYDKFSQLWCEYFYGYIIGFIMIKEQEA